MSALGDKLDLTAMTVNGRTLGENIEGAEILQPEVIRTPETAIYQEGATAVLTGNLAPRGCVIKPSAVEPRLRKHRAGARVPRLQSYGSGHQSRGPPMLPPTT
jgi:dihydroxyacid dehydratase/phosphogluconate dehydratase